jgi:hypothetical protein
VAQVVEGLPSKHETQFKPQYCQKQINKYKLVNKTIYKRELNVNYGIKQIKIIG